MVKTAIVHYWLTGMGGGEQVLEALCKIWPGADIYTHVISPNMLSPLLKKRNIHTTFINKLPFVKKFYPYYLPLMPLALEQLDLSSYDLVISSESGPAKGVITRADTAHICYCHTPMRYLWDNYHQYLNSMGGLTRLVMRPIFHYLRMWDVATAMRVDAFAANSQNVAQRIKKHWRRECEIIYPPVRLAELQSSEIIESGKKLLEKEGAFYLFVGRLVEYKKADLAIRACAELKRKLIIIGHGSQAIKLKKLVTDLHANNFIFFLKHLDNKNLYSWYYAAEAVLFPGEEDFGIVPVESAASGTPVIAYGKGGVTDSIKNGESGIFFYEQSKEALKNAIIEFEQKKSNFSSEEMKKSIAKFSEKNFRDSFISLAERTLVSVKNPKF